MTVKPADFVVGSFWASGNTCEICRAGYQAYCVHRVLMASSAPGPNGPRIPLATAPSSPLPASPHRGRSRTCWPPPTCSEPARSPRWPQRQSGQYRRSRRRRRSRPHGALAANQFDNKRIIAFSRHADRQSLAREFGVTDVVNERGAEGIAKLKELTNGLGAHSVSEAVGTQEASSVSDSGSLS